MIQKVYNTKLFTYRCTYMVYTRDLTHVNAVVVMVNNVRKCFNWSKVANV